ncbi:MAG TPA: PQQ-dependent sugar dehydrogenase [Dyadobacter sp.]|nr:PQQ-dependent sugar dehydrogenase [Dyadobacter sp.]
MQHAIHTFTLKKYWMLSSFLCSILLTYSAHAQPSEITMRPIFTTGLSAPMQVLHAGDGSGRIFVTERAGVIKVFNSNAATPALTTFLNLNSSVTKVGTDGEGGLLSLAFHPDYAIASGANRGVFFAFYTNPAGNLVIERYKVANPLSDVASVTEAALVMTILHEGQSNHNGGEMHFGPDRLLYISTGDGGGGGDPNNNAQRTVQNGNLPYLLGKMLRINVNNFSTNTPYSIPAGNPFNNEVFDYGLRNPFRWSFDRQTGDMWIGDVGQNRWEEIDFRSATAAPGVNYGWNCFEGPDTHANTNPGCGSVANFEPAYHYSGQSVVGGVVYRGSRYIDLAGYYVGTDYFSGQIHLIKRNVGNTAWTTTVRPAATNPSGQNITGVSDIGEAENGELYAVSLTSGSLFRIEASGALPVTLTQFHGNSTIEGNKLYWETTKEVNFKMFDVEYSSDMKAFTRVGTVMPVSGGEGAKYRFSHMPGHADNAYYRLKLVDLDETYRYSKVISIQDGNDAGNQFVRPSFINSGILHVLLEKDFQSIEVVNTSGSVLHKQNITGKTGNLEIKINEVPSGIYLIRLQNAAQVKQQKVLVMH